MKPRAPRWSWAPLAADMRADAKAMEGQYSGLHRPDSLILAYAKSWGNCLVTCDRDLAGAAGLAGADVVNPDTVCGSDGWFSSMHDRDVKIPMPQAWPLTGTGYASAPGRDPRPMAPPPGTGAGTCAAGPPLAHDQARLGPIFLFFSFAIGGTAAMARALHAAARPPASPEAARNWHEWPAAPGGRRRGLLRPILRRAFAAHGKDNTRRLARRAARTCPHRSAQSRAPTARAACTSRSSTAPKRCSADGASTRRQTRRRTGHGRRRSAGS